MKKEKLPVIAKWFIGINIVLALLGLTKIVLGLFLLESLGEINILSLLLTVSLDFALFLLAAIYTAKKSKQGVQLGVAGGVLSLFAVSLQSVFGIVGIVLGLIILRKHKNIFSK